MSSIYDLEYKALRKQLLKFSRTSYGFSVFLIAYLFPIALFVSLIIFAILAFSGQAPNWLINATPIVFITFVASFMLANSYFYRELRTFVNYQSKNSKKS